MGVGRGRVGGERLLGKGEKGGGEFSLHGSGKWESGRVGGEFSLHGSGKGESGSGKGVGVPLFL